MAAGPDRSPLYLRERSREEKNDKGGERTNCTQVVIYSMTRRVCWPGKGQMQCKLWRHQQKDKCCWRKQSLVEAVLWVFFFWWRFSLFDGVFFSFNPLDTCHHRSRDSVVAESLLLPPQKQRWGFEILQIHINYLQYMPVKLCHLWHILLIQLKKW